MAKDIEYLKAHSPVNIQGISLKFSESAEHVGIIRSLIGNLPNILARIIAHKKTLGVVLHIGMA